MALVFSSSLLSSCSNDVHRVDGNIKYGTAGGPLGLLNVHSSGKGWMEIKGRRYSNLAGFPPYYLEVPESGYVFFIEKKTTLLEPYVEKYSYHFYSTAKGEVVFNEQTRLFANSLGRDHNPKFVMKVAQIRPEVMLVSERTESVFGYYVFDLKRHTVTQTFEEVRGTPPLGEIPIPRGL